VPCILLHLCNCTIPEFQRPMLFRERVGSNDAAYVSARRTLAKLALCLIRKLWAFHTPQSMQLSVQAPGYAPTNFDGRHVSSGFYNGYRAATYWYVLRTYKLCFDEANLCWCALRAVPAPLLLEPKHAFIHHKYADCFKYDVHLHKQFLLLTSGNKVNANKLYCMPYCYCCFCCLHVNKIVYKQIQILVHDLSWVPILV
jgi:hypothetical protein